MELGIEIVMLKLVCTENVMIRGHFNRAQFTSLWKFCFYICMEFPMHIMKFSVDYNLSMVILILQSISVKKKKSMT